LLDALRRISWFTELPIGQLAELSRRCRLEHIGRYRTIIREGNPGKYFYVLLQGQVHVTSTMKKGLSVRLSATSAFGEGALITEVMREATVTALDPCVLMLLSAKDMVGIDVDLSTVRIHVISLLLESVYFFRDLAKQQQEELAQCMDIVYMEQGAVVFEQDEPGDAMYVLLEGKIEMLKRSSNDQLIGTFVPTSDRPWFGELALVGRRGRTAAAVCAETCKMLVVRSLHFQRFMEIAPSFQGMFMQQKDSYRALESMRRAGSLSNEDNVLNVAFSALQRPDLLGSSLLSQASAERVLERWRLLTRDIVARARLNVAAAEDRKEKEEELTVSGKASVPNRRGSQVAKSTMPHRRVSYVAGHAASDRRRASTLQPLMPNLEE